MSVTPSIAGIEAMARALMDEAKARGLTVSADLRVSEHDLATLLGMSAKSLKKRRLAGEAPPHYWLPVDGSKVSYRVTDAAAWVETVRRVAKPPQTSPKVVTPKAAGRETEPHESKA